MSLVLPASTSVPTGTSVIELLKRTKAKSLMTVPFIHEDIAIVDEPGSVATLSDLIWLHSVAA